MVEAAVLSNNDVDTELLLSLGILLKWDLVPPLFPNQTVTDHVNTILAKMKYNKTNTAKYSSLYSQNETVDEGKEYKLSEPSKECIQLKQKLLNNHKNLFKEVLDKTDRINGPPVRLILDPNKKVKPVAHCKPFDVPFNLRKSMETEISQAVTAGILSPCNEATAWCHQLFPVPKPGRIVSDFKRLNSAML